MKNSIKLKNGKELKALLNDPRALTIIVKIAFYLDETTGEAIVDFPEDWAGDIDKLVLVGLISHNDYKVFALENKKVADITLKKKPGKNKIDSQPLRGALIIPNELKQYYDIALQFNKLFYQNIQSIGGRVNNIENAEFGKWVNPVRLMFERDNITVEQLREVWEYLRSNEFWKKNVQSTSKLREKFNTIYNQAKGKQAKKETKNKVSNSYMQKIFDELND